MSAECKTAAPHVPEPGPDAEQLEWVPWDGSGIRSLEATCATCRPLYELVMLGGAYRVRRTVGSQVRLTPPMATRPQVETWWVALLQGRAV